MTQIKTYNIAGRDYNVFAESCCGASPKRTLYVQLTNACQARCLFCNCITETDKNRMIDPNILSRTIDAVQQSNAIHSVSFTGGEPLMFCQLEWLL